MAFFSFSYLFIWLPLLEILSASTFCLTHANNQTNEKKNSIANNPNKLMSTPDKRTPDAQQTKTTLPRLQTRGDTQIQTLFSVFAYKLRSHRLAQQAQATMKSQRQNTDASPDGNSNSHKNEPRNIFGTNPRKQQQQ
jgi:hypothetical protein